MSLDALNQYVALLYRLDAKSGPQGRRPQGIDVYLFQVSQLTSEDAWVGVRQLQRWLASFPPEPSAEFITKLVELAVNYRVPNPPTLKDVFKGLLGASGSAVASQSSRIIDEEDDDLEGGGERFDCAGWLDKATEDLTRDEGSDTIELFLFKTAALVLDNMKATDGLQLVQSGAVAFFFSSIEMGSTLSVQRMAAYCSGVLSHKHLPMLLDLFSERCV